MQEIGRQVLLDDCRVVVLSTFCYRRSSSSLFSVVFSADAEVFQVMHTSPDQARRHYWMIDAVDIEVKASETGWRGEGEKRAMNVNFRGEV